MNSIITICKSLRKKIALQLLLTFFISVAFAQEKITVSGKVTNGEIPLTDVTVKVAGSNQATTTDEQGSFRITATRGQTLVFSYVGYEGQSLVVSEQREINIVLKNSGNNALNEVVVVGYGTTKKVNLTGAVSTVSAKDLEGRPITNLSSALQGTMAGVTVTVNNGQPGADQGTIRVRGIGTLGNSDAMVLVDGVVSSMDDINPSDIESITVLKDAASASIYGSRAANGVILITTKKVRKGKLLLIITWILASRQ